MCRQRLARTMFNVAIIDDPAIAHIGPRQYLSKQPDLRFVAEGSNGRDPINLPHPGVAGCGANGGVARPLSCRAVRYSPFWGGPADAWRGSMLHSLLQIDQRAPPRHLLPRSAHHVRHWTSTWQATRGLGWCQWTRLQPATTLFGLRLASSGQSRLAFPATARSGRGGGLALRCASAPIHPVQAPLARPGLDTAGLSRQTSPLQSTPARCGQENSP